MFWITPFRLGHVLVQAGEPIVSWDNFPLSETEPRANSLIKYLHYGRVQSAGRAVEH